MKEPAQLGSGGTWQVTIIAKKNGQTIASKQMQRQRHGRDVDDRQNGLTGARATASSFSPGCCCSCSPASGRLRHVPLDALPDISDVR